MHFQSLAMNSGVFFRLCSRPCEIQIAATSRIDVDVGNRTRGVLTVAPEAISDFSNAPNRLMAYMTTADKAQKSPRRRRRVMARSSQRML